MNLTVLDGKNFAPVSEIFPWVKNPRIIKRTNMEKLKKQIKELGLYKPLLVTAEGEILGGHQRFQALKELGDEKVWVSVVNAVTDDEKLKYALSDNLNLGTYTKDRLNKVLEPFASQPGLFKEYTLDLKDPQNIEQFVKENSIDEKELQRKALQKTLKDAGVDKDTINIVVDMSNFKEEKNDVIYEDPADKTERMKDTLYNIRFIFKDEATYNEMIEQYREASKRMNTEKLILATRKYQETLPFIAE